jgi:phosphoglycolate phosphatase-like HAD superfamily hydrolase
MKKLVVFVYFLMVATGLVFSQTNGTAPSKDNVSRAARLLGVAEADLQSWINNKFIAVPTDIPDITAVQLYQEYEASQPRADRAYKGKQIKVTGVVDSIEEAYDTNSNRKYALYIKTGTYSAYVRVFLDDSDIDRLFDINVGQTVSIMGILVGKSGYITIDRAKML